MSGDPPASRPDGRRPDPAEALRRRLQAALRSALLARRDEEVRALRILIAAVDNAGAVPAPTRTGVGPTEVERRWLDHEELDALLAAEALAFRRAADAYGALGRSEAAARAARAAALTEGFRWALPKEPG